MWSLHVLPVYAWVLSGYSSFPPPSKNIHVRLIGVSKIVLLDGFPPPSKNIHVRLIGVSKIVLRSECKLVCGGLSLCGPGMDWRPVQVVPRLSADDR